MTLDALNRFESAYGLIVKAAGKAYSFINAHKGDALRVLKKSLVPLKVVSIIGYSALCFFDIGCNVKRTAQMKGRYKIIPSFKIITSSGELMGELGKGLLLIASKAPHFLKALHFASTTLGVASVGLQVFGLAANIWESVSVRQQIRDFNALKKENPQQALKGICSELGDRKIFRVITKKHASLINTILKKEGAFTPKLFQTTKVIEKHNRSARALQIVKTVVNILMVLGLALLLFAPTPFAPALLGIMMVAMGVSFLSMLSSSIQSRRCTLELKQLAT